MHMQLISVKNYNFVICIAGDILDRGNFGVVYKAILTKDGAQFVYPGIEVAAKKNSESVAVHEFKAILCEIKTLAYIGNHANIVKFHGACVENIKKREMNTLYAIIYFIKSKSGFR